MSNDKNDQTKITITEKPVLRDNGGKFAPGTARFPGNGRPPGSLNKKAVAIEQILQERADKQGKSLYEVSAIGRLYMFMDGEDVALGFKPGTITPEQKLEAAKHLSQFEAPKKRSVEVTGSALVGEAFVISTGAPKPEKETDDQWAERAESDALEVEKQKARERLAELEEEKRSGKK